MRLPDAANLMLPGKLQSQLTSSHVEELRNSIPEDKKPRRHLRESTYMLKRFKSLQEEIIRTFLKPEVPLKFKAIFACVLTSAWQDDESESEKNNKAKRRVPKPDGTFHVRLVSSFLSSDKLPIIYSQTFLFQCFFLFSRFDLQI